MWRVLEESKDPVPGLRITYTEGRRETNHKTLGGRADTRSGLCLGTGAKPQPASSSELWLLHMVRPGSSSLPGFVGKVTASVGWCSQAPDAPWAGWDVPSRATKLHSHIPTIVPLAAEGKKEILWEKSPTERIQGTKCGKLRLSWMFSALVTGTPAPRCPAQALLWSQLAVLPLTQIPARDRGTGMAIPPRAQHCSTSLFLWTGTLNPDTELSSAS